MEKKLKRKPFVEEIDLLDVFDTAKSNKELSRKIAFLAKKGILTQLDKAVLALEFAKGNLLEEYFAKLINDMYEIKLDDYKDFYPIFSLATGKKYSPKSWDILYTTMKKEKLEIVDGEIKWRDKMIVYKVVSSDDFKDNKYKYTISDIKELIESGQIIILEEFEHDIGLQKQSEGYKAFPIHRNFREQSESNAFYPHIVEYLRQNIGNQQIAADVSEYLSALSDRIERTLDALEPCGNVRVQCEKEIENANIRERIKEIKKQADELATSLGKKDASPTQTAEETPAVFTKK